MDQTTGGLICPKCHGTMRRYERNGVTIDQCGECRGIFLDRGELERLIDAETSFYNAETAGAPRSRAGYEDPSRDRSDGYHDRDRSAHEGKRRRGGFLGDLFD
jgi:Zn-finger nucleic acid-binding protein